MKEDIEYLQRFINRCKKSGSEFYGILKPGHFESLQNLINKNKEQEKIIELMAKDIAEITESCPYDLYDCKRDDCEDICANISYNDETYKCFINYFKKKAKGE